MLSKFVFSMFLAAVTYSICSAQGMNTTAGLFYRNENEGNSIGQLNIYQDPGIDTLISRYIIYNMKLNGLEGFRIQVYSSSNKNAREESGKKRAEFISKFPDIKSYASFEPPAYYKIRVGDYRSKIEGTKDLMMVRKVFPDAILVPDIINFPDPN